MFGGLALGLTNELWTGPPVNSHAPSLYAVFLGKIS